MPNRVAIKEADRGVFAISLLDYLEGDGFDRYKSACAGARYDRARGANVVSDTGVLGGILGRLREAGLIPVLDDATKAAMAVREQSVRADLDVAEGRMDAMDTVLASRGLALYPFQRTGVRWLVSRSSALLADEMGTGKTIEALASLPAADSIGALVVCPAVVKGSWKKEIERWRPDFRVSVLAGKGSFRWPERGEILIVNYDVLPSATMKPNAHGFKEPTFDDEGLASKKAAPARLILDEAHYAKNAKAKRTVACRALANACQGALVMTATPLVNRPPELYSVLQLGGLAQEAFGSFSVFKQLFGGVDERVSRDQTAIVWKGITDPDEVGRRLSRVMIRRLRSEVLPDLPVKTRREVEVDISEKAKKLAEKLLAEAAEAAGEEALNIYDIKEISDLPFEMFSSVRKALAEAKIEALEAMVDAYEEQAEPVVVFSAHQGPLDALGKREGWGVIHGGVSHARRTELVVAFQAGHLKGLACGIKSAGVGITLTRAAHMIFVDRAWTPGDNFQAEDRCLRIGQTRGVLVSILVADHALDKHIAYLIGKKMEMVENSVEKGRVVDKQVEHIDVQKLVREAEAETSRIEAKLQENKAKAEATGGKVTKKGNVIRPAKGPLEEWAKAGLEQLLLACDGVLTEDGVGFSLVTRGAGAALAKQLLATGGMLSDKQWIVAVKICRVHHAQVGDADGEV